MAVLLLQGPLGSFFNYFSHALHQQGVVVHRIVFNGGDQYFSGDNAIAYTGSQRDWYLFLAAFVRDNNIDTVIAYGDCRAYHFDARRMCLLEGIRYFALEEGYLRPNYITIEEGGVNGHSPITEKGIKAYQPIHSPKNESVIPGNFFKRMVYAATYYNVALFRRFKFKRYSHHRSFNPAYEAFCWIRGFVRKVIYKVTEKSAQAYCHKGDFFIVPLQVHNDAQIEFHSNFKSIGAFIAEVIKSFAESGRSARLLIKHHPMDRGYVNYKKLIFALAKQYGLQHKIDYIHDQHLPTLLKHCEGVVTINSTTALQAFYHGAAVKALGDAFFDMDGLTHQGSLSSFWHQPEKPDPIFSDQFKAYLLDHGQINGSFYCEYDMTIHNLIAYLKKLKAI